jgi:hypothetical protein
VRKWRRGAARRAAARRSATRQTGTRRAVMSKTGPALSVRAAIATHELDNNAFGSTNRDWPRNREDAITQLIDGR